jgi:hypothetical protein
MWMTYSINFKTKGPYCWPICKDKEILIWGHNSRWFSRHHWSKLQHSQHLFFDLVIDPTSRQLVGDFDVDMTMTLWGQYQFPITLWCLHKVGLNTGIQPLESNQASLWHSDSFWAGSHSLARAQVWTIHSHQLPFECNSRAFEFRAPRSHVAGLVMCQVRLRVSMFVDGWNFNFAFFTILLVYVFSLLGLMMDICVVDTS